MARDEVGGKTGAGDEDDLDSKTGRDNDTNDPTLAPGTRGDTPGQMFTATDFDETLWGKQDEPDDATEPQEARQSNNNPALQSLRPNVVRPAPSRNLKAKAGAWGTSKLAIPQKDVISTPVPSAADKAALIRRRLVTVKNKPTAEERFRKDYFERVKNPVIKTPKPQAPVDSPSLPGRQPPQKNQRKRRASPRATVFSSDEDDEVDDEDEDEDVPVVLMNRHRRATTAERPQYHDRQNQKATSALPDKAVADQVSQQEDDDEEDEDDDNDEDDDEDDDDPPIVQPSRRRRVQFTSPSQSNDSPDQPTTSPLSSNSKAAAGRLLQTVKDVSSPLSDKALVDQRLQVDDDEVKEGDAPIAEHDRRHRRLWPGDAPEHPRVAASGMQADLQEAGVELGAAGRDAHLRRYAVAASYAVLPAGAGAGGGGGAFPRARIALCPRADQPVLRFVAGDFGERHRTHPLHAGRAAFPCRRRGAWHQLLQDAGRCRLLCVQQPGQRPFPADHRVQPPLHPPDARGRGARRGALGQRQAPRADRRGAHHRCRRR